MASVYPGGLDSLATNKANATATTTDHPDHHNDLADAVNKIEAELGVTPSGAEATVAARLTAIEAAGGGGATATILGSDMTGTITFLDLGSTTHRCLRITAPTDGLILAVGLYVKPDVDNVPGAPAFAILTNSGNEADQVIALTHGSTSDNYLLNTTTDVARWIYWPLVAPLTAGDYWIEVQYSDPGGWKLGEKVGQAVANRVGSINSGYAYLVEKGTTSSTWSAGTDELMTRAIFQPAAFF